MIGQHLKSLKHRPAGESRDRSCIILGQFVPKLSNFWIAALEDEKGGGDQVGGVLQTKYNGDVTRARLSMTRDKESLKATYISTCRPSGDFPCVVWCE